MRKSLAQFAGLAVAHEDGVAYVERQRPFIADGRLHFARAFEREQLRALRQVGRRLLFRADRTGGDIAAAQAGVYMRMGVPHDLESERGSRLIAEVAIVIEERRSIESRSNRNLGDYLLSASSSDAACSTAIDERLRA